MEINPEEISSVIKERIKGHEDKLKMESVGTVLEVGDGVATVHGLEDAMYTELIEFPGETFGMAMNLKEDSVGCVILGDDRHISEGDEAKCTGRIVQVPVGEELLGRVVNAIGQPMDDKGPIASDTYMNVERKAPGVVERQPVDEPLQTGWKAVDSMIPIGRGQRELILGDRQTGKTALVVDTILNQKNSDMKCIYVAIGQKMSTIASVRDTLEEHGAMEYTTIVAAPASDPAPFQYIAPYAGTAMGEYFRDNGMHAFVTYDDLSKHAWAYRQISLLLRRPPGREAYPGDIFNLHSRLLERSAKMNDDLGAGSLTSIPIIETQEGDVSAYIPTNVISITDGQIYLEPELFNEGVRPAINVGLSVSRVGGDAQIGAMKDVAGDLRLELAQFRELEAFSQFESELDEATRAKLQRGQKMVETLKQDENDPMTVEEQVAVIYAATGGFLADIPVDRVIEFEEEFLERIHDDYPGILKEIGEEQELTESIEGQLDDAIASIKSSFLEEVPDDEIEEARRLAQVQEEDEAEEEEAEEDEELVDA